MIRKLFFLFASTFFATTFFAAALPAAADTVFTNDSCFAHIDSNLYVVADFMPRYTEEVFVGKISSEGYNVELFYPEFQNLSGKELRKVRELQKSGVVPTDEALDATGVFLMPTPTPVSGLELEQVMLVDRKQGYLNISFCPIVRHEGVWKRILSCQVKVSAKAASRNSAPAKAPENDGDRWASSSVLASGKWAKVSVTKEGIYQLTASDIQKMGFSDLSKVRVYGYGGLIQNEVFDFATYGEDVLDTNAPDDLVEVPLYATADGRLLFWAEGTVKQKWNKTDKKYTHEQNHYSTYSAYFVTENDQPRTKLATLPAVEADRATRITDVPYVTVLDNDVTSWYPGGRRMFDSHDFATGSTQSYRLATPGLNINASGTKLVDVAVGASSSITRTTFSVKVNDEKLGNVSVDSIDAGTESARTSVAALSNPSHLLANEPNVFQLTSNNNNKARLDFIRVNYPRTLQLTDDPYSFSPQTTGAVTLNVSGANATTHLWRIGQKGSPTAEVPTELNGSTLVGTAASGLRRYVFFDESATFASPTFMGEVANQNLHADRDVNYVIIIPANGKVAAQAERLGKIHEKHDGFSYKVVRADQLYNEFSSGTPDANAYRRYLKMLYDRAGDNEEAMPRYCLFIGKGSWDNRLITEENKGKSQDDFLLAFEADYTTFSVGSVNSYVTDDFFGLLDDGEGAKYATERVDVALGRLVCANEPEAQLLVDKIESYINNNDAGSWKNTIAFLADNGDHNDHMECADYVVNVFDKAAPSLNIQKVYWDRYVWTSSATGYSFPQATARIRQLMTEGTALFNYSGHGSPNMISHYKILQTPDFAEALSPHMAVWVLASCEIYPFDTGENNLAETSLYLPNGGSIAFICATRAVYAPQNKALNRYYCANALTKEENGRYRSLGESLRRSKHELVLLGGDNGINKLKYICFGDPALSLAIPTGTVVLDSIDGRSLKDLGSLTPLAAGSAVKFSGHVCQMGSDEIDETFDGNVSATVFDCAEEVTCKLNLKEENPAPPYVFSERSKSIFKGSTKAEGGKFEFVVSIPRDISYTNNPGRISFYAVSNDKVNEYNGFSHAFCLNGTAEMAEPDTKGPEVIAYINSIDNPDYTITDENPILIADIRDDYGINNAGVSLGHDIELVIDGNNAEPINLNAYFNYDFGSYQKGQLVYEMKNMSRGQHTAQLRVWDVNNNATISDVHFIVRSETAEGGKDGYVTATKNPATTDTRFITYFPADAQVEGLAVYEVYDTRGRCVYKQPVSVAPGSSTASLTWDLCGNDHSPLPSGIYFYRTVINTSNGSHATDAQKLIITRQ